jgi:hypothetical protein
VTTLVFIAGPPAVGKMTVGHELNSRGAFDAREDYLRVDNTELSVAEVAELIIERFGLTTVDAQPGS